MNVLQKSIEAFITSQGKTAAAGLKLRHDLQDVYLPENGVGEILRDVYGEDATRRTHETQYNAIHYAWVTIGDDGKRKPRQPRQPEDGSEGGKGGKGSEDSGKGSEDSGKGGGKGGAPAPVIGLTKANVTPERLYDLAMTGLLETQLRWLADKINATIAALDKERARKRG